MASVKQTTLKLLKYPSFSTMKNSPILSREILKWIQSLDLSHSFKSVTRDFSNGYLIAEILSLHYPSLVHMESFENINSKDGKLHNWEYIRVLLHKQKIEFPCLTDDFINEIVTCSSKGGINMELLLNELYLHLTGKRKV